MICIISSCIYIYDSFKKVLPCHTYHPNDSMDDASTQIESLNPPRRTHFRLDMQGLKAPKTLEMVALKLLSWFLVGGFSPVEKY